MATSDQSPTQSDAQTEPLRCQKCGTTKSVRERGRYGLWVMCLLCWGRHTGMR